MLFTWFLTNPGLRGTPKRYTEKIAYGSRSALSAIYIGRDLTIRTPEMKVTKWGWILVTLYMGPVAFIVYWFSGSLAAGAVTRRLDTGRMHGVPSLRICGLRTRP